ncbi:hypothetical protein Tco_1088004 [Tanacetum coccineum]
MGAVPPTPRTVPPEEQFHQLPEQFPHNSFVDLGGVWMCLFITYLRSRFYYLAITFSAAFWYLAEARTDKRHWTGSKWVLKREIWVKDAGVSNNGFLRCELNLNVLHEGSKFRAELSGYPGMPQMLAPPGVPSILDQPNPSMPGQVIHGVPTKVDESPNDGSGSSRAPTSGLRLQMLTPYLRMPN